MNNWKIVKIGDILKVKSGKNQKTITCDSGKYQILGTGGEIGRTNSFLYNKPSVLIGRKGTIDKPIYKDEPFWTVDTLFYTEIKDRFLPKYIYYLFLTINWRKYNEASGVPSLTASTIEKIKVKMPNLETQQKIVQILDSLHKQISTIDSLIEAYGTLFRTTRKIFVSNAKGPQYRFEECFTEIPKPKGVKKNLYEQKGKYPIIDQERNKQISGWTNNEKCVTNIQEPCIIFGDHSRVVKYIEKGKYVFSNDGIKMIITKNIVNNYYGYLLLSNIDIPDTGYNRHFKYLKIEKFTIPSLKKQKKITDFFKTVNKLIISLDSKKQSLSHQYRYLLNHLINGDFDLSNIKLENGKEHK